MDLRMSINNPCMLNLSPANRVQILEGLATILVGIASYWMVHDFPAEATFLSPDDRARVLRRLRSDKQASSGHEDFQMKYFWQSVKDWKTLAFAIIYMGADGSLYAFSLFLPTIIAGLGYTSTMANLLSVPPYAIAAVVTVVVGYIADRTQQRGYCNMFTSIFGIVGFAMLLGSGSPNVQYAGTFLGAIGIYREYSTSKREIRWSFADSYHSDNRKHNLLGSQQRRGRVQARCHPWLRHRLGQHQWRCVFQYLSQQR